MRGHAGNAVPVHADGATMPTLFYAYFHRNTCICIRSILGQTSSVCPSFSCRRRQGFHPPSPSFLHSGRCSYTSLCSSYASLCSAASLPQPGDRNTAAKRGREDSRHGGALVLRRTTWRNPARLGVRARLKLLFDLFSGSIKHPQPAVSRYFSFSFVFSRTFE